MSRNDRYVTVFSLFSALSGSQDPEYMAAPVGRGLELCPGFTCTLISKREEGEGEKMKQSVSRSISSGLLPEVWSQQTLSKWFPE